MLQTDGSVKFHPSSVNDNMTMFPHRWMVYFEKVRSVGGLFLFDTSCVSPLPLLLFGAGDDKGNLLQRDAQYVGTHRGAACDL